MVSHLNNISPDRRREMAAKGAETRRLNAAKRLCFEEQSKRLAFELKHKVGLLSEQLDRLNKAMKLSKLSSNLGLGALYREEDIVSNAQPWASFAGVYFLIFKGKVVYVGQSRNVFQRMAEHQNKKFDAYAYILCDEDLLDKLESLYIHLLDPPLNGTVKGGAKCVPLTLEKLIG